MTSWYLRSTAVRKRTLPILLAAALLCGSLGPASASVIVEFVGASGPGLASMSFNNLGTPAAGNDDFVGESPNWLSVNQKAYDQLDYIDMVFRVEDFGVPATEYIFTEGVHNGTGQTWTDYHMELGFGVGAGFVVSPPGDGLDFDAPDYNSPFFFVPFGTVTVGEDTIDCVDGFVPDGSFNVWAFTIDVPEGNYEFTIRQWPTTDAVPVDPTGWSHLKAMFN
jgi:hypothetical protein